MYLIHATGQQHSMTLRRRGGRDGNEEIKGRERNEGREDDRRIFCSLYNLREKLCEVYSSSQTLNTRRTKIKFFPLSFSSLVFLPPFFLSFFPSFFLLSFFPPFLSFHLLEMKGRRRRKVRQESCEPIRRRQTQNFLPPRGTEHTSHSLHLPILDVLPLSFTGSFLSFLLTLTFWYYSTCLFRFFPPPLLGQAIRSVLPKQFHRKITTLSHIELPKVSILTFLNFRIFYFLESSTFSNPLHLYLKVVSSLKVPKSGLL